MKKIILAPDSFKGTMSAMTVCRIMEKSILDFYPNAHIISVPIADGGEGSVDALLRAKGGEKIEIPISGPYFNPINSFYGKMSDGLGIIEVAAASGFTMVQGKRRVGEVTTYGVGQLIRHAVKNGCKKILVCLGGSAGNDMGAGAAAALGVKFINRCGESFVPVGNTLGQIAHIDCTESYSLLKDVEILAMCDVDNPLFGENGAAYVYGPQKGADKETVLFLDIQMQKAADVISRDLGRDIATIPGAGAAGGMGGGLLAFLNAKLEKGIELLLNVVEFETLIQDADMIFSGEGCLDSQSLRGKVIYGIGQMTKKTKTPLVAVVGRMERELGSIYENGVTAAFPINRDIVDMEQLQLNAEVNLKETMDNIMRLLSSIKP